MNIENLIDELAKEGIPVQPAPHPMSAAMKWLGWGLAYLALALMISGLRPDWAQKLRAPLFLAEISALFLVFFSATASAALLSFPDLFQKRWAAWSPVAAFALFAIVLFLAWLADSPPAPLPKHSFECTLSIMLAAALPAILLLATMRKFASTHGDAAGSAAMLAAFSIGALWLRLYEVNDSIAHVLEWHYLPMLIFAALGLSIGKRVLKW